MTAFETMQKYYKERDLAAKEWKKKGGKVVGYFCTNVPEEVISAAGLLPIRVTGNPFSDTTAADRYLEYYFCPFVRSIYNNILTGKYDFLDLLVIPHSCDSVARTYWYLFEEQRVDPDLKIPERYLFDILHTRHHDTILYVRDQVRAFKERLEGLSGKEISDNSLAHAITVTNDNRVLLKKVADLRKMEPPRVTGMEALQIIGSSMFMPKEEHNKLLRQFLKNEADQLPARNSLRLFLSGSCLDNLVLYELIESLGATIISEDICTGNRYSDNLIETSSAPVEAIAERYVLKSSCGHMYPMLDSAKYTANRVKEAQGQGVIFNYLKWCDSLTWNYVDTRKELDAMDVPHLALEMQEYSLGFAEQLKTRIEAFIESI